ncbi:FtsX-like permease family protein [Lysinibacillus sp. fls2-241-R2A-57]|uniref:FtsX-like permease family protein n=1 Tax=Lysinibacillus sp. fls2-241-R2A-57 TaxID=3040292 RepID=UPI002553194B|nr:FtsX-like permease family protein [Lysinibacillus sp. fls2-241-R2A-57]
MINSVSQLAFRFFKHSRLLVLTSVLGILLSISLIITMMMFISSAKQSMVDELEMMFGDMDLAVGYNDDDGKVINQELYNRLTEIPMVDKHSGVLLTHLYIEQINGYVYTIGANSDELTKSRYHFNEDLNYGEIILNESLAEKLAVSIGDPVIIEGVTYYVKEIKSDLVQAGPTVHNIVVNSKQLQEIKEDQNKTDAVATYILMTVHEEEKIYNAVEQIRKIDPDLRIDIAKEEDFIKNNLNLLYQYMVVLSVLVILMTSLFIITNFDVFLYKYKNQLAIMRSVGASTRQVFQVMFIQSFFINILGCLGGLLVTYLTYGFLYPGLETLLGLNVQEKTFNIGLATTITAIGFVILQVGMLIPVYKSSRILPLKIVQSNETIDVSYPKLRWRIGCISLIISCVLIILSKIIADQRIELVLIAALMFLVGVVLLLPFIVKSLLYSIQRLIKPSLGNVAYTAINMMIPQTKRNAFVITIIVLMVTVTLFGSSFIQTIKISDENYIHDQYYTDILISAPITDQQYFSPQELREALQKVNALDSTMLFSVSASGKISKSTEEQLKTGIPYVYTFFEDLTANFSNTATGIILTKSLADQLNTKIGDQLDFMSVDAEDFQVAEVVDIVESLPNDYQFTIDFRSTFGRKLNSNDEKFKPIIEYVYIESVDHEAALGGLQEVVRQFPELQVSSYDESLAQSKEMSMQRTAIFIIVLMIILISVMLGIINTLISNINSKRRELSILRVISMTKNDIVRFITTQVICYIVLGVAIGTAIGLIFTWIVSQIDKTLLIINFDLYGLVVGCMFLLTLMVFIPYGLKIGNLHIMDELTQDNK